MARLLVSDGTLAKEATVYKIALDGIIVPIRKALGVKEGIARCYWGCPFTPAPPPVAPDQDRVTEWWEFERPSRAQANTPLYGEVDALLLNSQNHYTSVDGLRGLGGLVDITGGESFESADTIPFTLINQIWGVSLWWKTPASLAGEGDLEISGQWNVAALESAGDRKWRILYNFAADGFVFVIHQGGAFPTLDISIDTGDISVAPSTWYHMVGTHDPDADEMSFTVSEQGGSVGTRATATVVGGAWIGDAGSPGMEWNIGNTANEGVIDMHAFWGGTTILSADNVSALFLGELTYAELANPLPVIPLVEDSFTDTNGTGIVAHSANMEADVEGGGWLLDAGGLTIESNALLPSTLVGEDRCRIDTGQADCIITVSGTTSYVDASNRGDQRILIHANASAILGYEVRISPFGFTGHLAIYRLSDGVQMDAITIPELEQNDNVAWSIVINVIDQIDPGEAMIDTWLTVGSNRYSLLYATATENQTDSHYGCKHWGQGTYTMRPFDDLSVDPVPGS
jgi:hypothetical protein